MSKVTVNKINTQFSEEYAEQDLKLIPAFEVISQFTPETDVVEFSIYNEQGLLEYINYNYTDYTVTLDYNTQQNSVSSVNINIEEDVIKKGYEQGNYTTNYAFLRNQLSSSVSSPYYIKQVSSDRTEIRIANNNISNEVLENIVNQFKTELNESAYFEDFQINLGNNNIFIANNILVDTSNSLQYTVLIKLYEPLEEQFEVKDTLWVTLQTAGEVSYQVNFAPKIITPPTPPQLKGPNFNIETKDIANNSTIYQDLNSLLDTALTASYNQIQGILAEKGITVNIDYSDFNNFIYFSSAEKRVRNFYYKLQQIEEYDEEIVTLNSSILNDSGSSINILERKKGEIIQNFDGYEKFQYYTSGSSISKGIYPKQAEYPYRPISTNNTFAVNWLNQEATSGSNYDLENPDKLVNSLPDFVVDDTSNIPFLDFMDMVGQHFDNIWTYTKDISNRFNADNRLNYGISKDLVADAIKSMGVNLYQNNFTDTNLYTAFTNLNPDGTGSYINEVTNEVVTQYITTNYNDTGLVVPGKGYVKGDVFYYSLAGEIDIPRLYFYVNGPTFTAPADSSGNLGISYQAILLGFINSGIIALQDFSDQPTIIDDVNKKIYKRIYHNLPYLLKKKGSIEGLRALINCYGIPDTILRISEFGGKDKTNSNDWDYFQNKFNYAFSTSGSWENFTSLFTIDGAWPELMGVGPTTFTVRFKPDALPSSNTDYKVLVESFKSNPISGEWALALEYTGSGLLSSSYSGSIPSESKYDANLVLWDTLGSETEVVRVTAPFYNGNWWTTAITVDPTAGAEGDVVLYALENIYNGNNGFKLGINTSASYSGDTEWWDGTELYIPSKLEAGLTIDGTSYIPLTGSFQEVRYYGVPLSQSRVYDLAMNPYSIEGNDYSSSANDLAFRAPLGSDLLLTNLTQSVHPKITGSFGFITQSFSADSYYNISSENNFVPNTEFIYYDQPAVGIKNRISEKIRSVDNITPSGDTLTPYRTIQQRYPQSESYTRDVDYLEVAFSPQNEINDDINSSFGYFNIGEYIGDPRQVSESNTSYQDLDKLRDNYFQKYYKSYDWKDYIRLIKYFDNSLFKMIKDFVPAKTSVSTGVVIKQHLLERNKHKPTQIESSQHDYSGSISSGFISGGSAGLFDDLAEVSPQVTQSWTYTIPTISGSLTVTQSTQDEFYNGEFEGTVVRPVNNPMNPYTASYFSAGELVEAETIVYSTVSPGEYIYGFNDIGDYETYESNAQSISNKNATFVFLNETENDRTLGDNQKGITRLKFGMRYWDGAQFNPTSASFKAYSEGDIMPLEIFSGSSVPWGDEIGTTLKVKIGGIRVYSDNNRRWCDVIVANPLEVLRQAPTFFALEGTRDGEIFENTIIHLHFNPKDLIKFNPPSPLNGQVNGIRPSNIYLDIDYSNSTTTPINLDVILGNAATPALVRDSNYTSKGWSNPRYNGSRASSLGFNIKSRNSSGLTN